VTVGEAESDNRSRLPYYSPRLDSRVTNVSVPFTAILQVDSVCSSKGNSGVWWRDLHTGTEYLMKCQTFNAMLKNKETQWEGHLLVDGCWVLKTMNDGGRGNRDRLFPVHPSQMGKKK